MEDLPLVSVIVPCYNHEDYITECLRSIMDQTYQNFEVIVIDDGSIDKSVEILRELQNEYNFILIEQINRGASATINRGIKEFATGKYITFCASDDYWCLDKLEKQVSLMEANPQFYMCYGKTYYIDINSKPLANPNKSDEFLRGGEIFEDIFLFRFHPPVTYLFKSEIYKHVGYYDEKIAAEDYHMNLKISSKYPVGYLDEYLGYYRVDYNQNKIIRFDKVSNSHLMSIEEYKSHPLYIKAKQTVYLRKFNVFSGFRKYKNIAVVNLFRCLPLFYRMQFIKGLIKLFVSWK